MALEAPATSEVTTQDAITIQLAKAIAQPMEILYKAGGLALVFVFVGFFCMQSAFYKPGPFAGHLFALGAFIMLVCVSIFAFSQVYAPLKARKLIRDNEQLINSVQSTAVSLTDTIAVLQSLLFKHSEQISELLETAAPTLTALPFIGEAGLKHTQNVNGLIVSTTESGKRVIEDVRSALITCDAAKLQQYMIELDALKIKIRDALSSELAPGNIPSMYKSAQLLEETVLEYTRVVEDTSSEAVTHLSQVGTLLDLACNLPMVGATIVRLGGERSLNAVTEIKQLLGGVGGSAAQLRVAVSTRDISALKSCLHDLNALAVQVEGLRRGSADRSAGVVSRHSDPLDA